MSKEYDTDPVNYQICSVIGQCVTNIGTVYIARHLPSKSLVAVKKFNLEKISVDDTELIQKEIILMRQLSQPNLMPCLTAFVSGLEIVCVLPLMGYGSCHDIMARHFPAGLPETVIAIILKAVVQALHYLHLKGIIHRGVRGSHILISEDGRVMLGGLRYSCPVVCSGRWLRKLHSFPPSTLSNLNWLSPELLQQNLEGYNEKSDVYSVGVTACELANGIVPFWDTATTLMLTEKVQGASPQLIDSSTFINPQDSHEDIDEVREGISEEYMRVVSERSFSERLHSLSSECMRREPSDRPSTGSLLHHPLFKHLPPSSHLPSLILPAVPVLTTSVLEVQDDLDSLMAAEKLNNLEVNTVSWDFT